MASPATAPVHQKLTLKKIDGKPGEVWYPLQIQLVPGRLSQPSPSSLLLHPTHLALNHRDLFLRQHLYPSPSFDTPLLSDACCTVLSPTPDPWSPSQPRRVLLNPSHGWLSAPLAPESAFSILGGTSTNPLGTAQTRLVVPAEETAPCPPHLSSAEAAALPLTGLTAWRALVTKSGAAEKGGHVLVTGIGGGVAICAAQFAVAMGCKVWVTSGEQGKIERAKKELGVEGGVNYKEKGWEKVLKGMLPKERPMLDAVIDGAGGDIVGKSVRLLKLGGVIVSYGMTVAPVISAPMTFVLANIEIRGSTMGSRKEFQEMVAFVDKHKIKPVVSRVVSGRFDEIEKWEELFEDMKAGRQFGKLVFEVKDDEGESGSKL